MTNRELRKELLKKLGITPQALSLRTKKLRKQCPMTTEDATYVIAHQEGIPIDKFLESEVVDRVRNLFLQVSPLNHSAATGKQPQRKKVPQSKKNIIVIANEFKGTDPILSPKKLKEAKEMATIYPLIYVMENSIRELIDLIMTSLYGKKWWDKRAGNLKTAVDNRMADDKKNAWHQRRGARPIDYLDLKDLPRLMRKIEKKVVPDIFHSFQWFDQMVKEVYESRCVICHMNPLDKDNIQNVKLKFKQWQKQIEAKKKLILKESKGA